MMTAIRIERIIAAPSERVFSALTEQDGLSRWWTPDASAKPEAGSLAEFRFRQGAASFQWEVAELEQNEYVYWILRQGSPAWAGTSVCWRLASLQNGTKLFFTHDGFQADEAYLGLVRNNWNYYLDSLKSYLETGKGTPGDPPYF